MDKSGKTFCWLGVGPDAAGDNEKVVPYRGTIFKYMSQDVNVYKEFHALIVRLGKQTCRNKPLCEACPLSASCKYPRRRKK